jgi:nitrate/nitrite transport system substrate-binding protein
MSTFDDPFDADRALSRSGCICGRHLSAAEHEQDALRLRCESVESREKRYEGVVASAVMRAMFPKDVANSFRSNWRPRRSRKGAHLRKRI